MIEEKLLNENTDLHHKVGNESSKNIDVSCQINDVTGRLRSAENAVVCMRKELDCCKTSNSVSMENNTNLNTQIASLNSHIHVVTNQNTELTRELDSFVAANEQLRIQLDRKARVLQVRKRNEECIAKSDIRVQQSKSPLRVPPPCEPIHVVREELIRVPVYEERVKEERIPVIERVERTIEHSPVGHRLERVPVHGLHHEYLELSHHLGGAMYGPPPHMSMATHTVIGGEGTHKYVPLSQQHAS